MRWKNILSRRRRERDLDAEIRQHIAIEERQRIDRGEDPADARANARRDFGNVDLVKEVTRDAWGTAWIDRLIADVRYAIRLAARNKSFAVTVLLILTLGIGASTTVYALLNALVLRDLPVSSPEELVWLKDPSFSYPIFQEVREQSGDLFQGVFAWTIENTNVEWSDITERAHTLYVSDEFYSTLRQNALLGRTLNSTDVGPVAVISFEAWERRLHKDPSVVGKTVSIERVPFTIVGVMPKGFFGVAAGLAPELTVPLNAIEWPRDARNRFQSPTSAWLHIMGRLNPGLSILQANLQFRQIWPRVLETVTPLTETPDRRARYLSRQTELMPGRNGFSRVRNQFGDPLWTLMGLVVLLLVVASVSLANLWAVRTSARRREIDLRLALGATRSRIVRQLFTEAIFITAIGAVLSLLFAGWGTALLVRLLSTGEDPVTIAEPLDIRVLTFAFTMSIAIAAILSFISALRPAFKRSGADLQPEARAVGYSRPAGKLRFVLVTCQVTVAVILVAGAVLFGRSLYRLVTVDPGFNAKNVLIVEMDPLLAGYRDAALTSFYERATDSFRTIPGVEAVSLSAYPPLHEQGAWTGSIQVDGGTFSSTGNSSVYFNTISPGYFSTIGQTLLSGRDFNLQDRENGVRTCIITESIARDFFPGQEAIGRTISVGRDKQRQNLEIIGIVRDAKYRRLQEPARRIAYFPYAQQGEVVNSKNLLAEIRTSGRPERIAGEVQRKLKDLDPSVLVRPEPLNKGIRDSLVIERVVAALSVFLGGAALLLATASLYGLLSYNVSQRTSEIGLRLALGADRSEVLWIVMSQSLVPLLAGLVLGVWASLSLGRFVEKLLYGMTPRDIAGLTITVVIVLTVAVVASYFPARRAVRIDPMTALRHE